MWAWIAVQPALLETRVVKLEALLHERLLPRAFFIVPFLFLDLVQWARQDEIYEG